VGFVVAAVAAQNRKNSVSGPAINMKPRSAACLITFLSVVRGQPANGCRRIEDVANEAATRAPDASVQGTPGRWPVGRRYMSDSSMRTKPSMDERRT